MTAVEVLELEAREVRPGDYVVNSLGERLKVLASYSARQTHAAQWVLEGYAEGQPTKRMGGSPSSLFRVERPL